MDDELRKIHDIINDVWRFMKKYYPAKDADEYWSAMTDEANDIWLKHDKHVFCQKMIITCMKYLQGRNDG